MKKSSIISLLLLSANWQSSMSDSSSVSAFKLEQYQMQTLNQKARDDDEEETPAAGQKKADEVEALMQKYDQEEKHEEYLKSPEFKKEQEKKKMKEIEAQQQKAQELQETLD